MKNKLLFVAVLCTLGLNATYFASNLKIGNVYSAYAWTLEPPNYLDGGGEEEEEAPSGAYEDEIDCIQSVRWVYDGEEAIEEIVWGTQITCPWAVAVECSGTTCS